MQSYKQLPCNLYQINLKFRDEIRPRFGVMRAREFMMKDGYSFHLDEASFDATYAEMHACYGRILSRMQLDFRAVLADTGNIGGSTSHEFQVLASTGEDRIAFSDASDYAANVEKAEAVAPAPHRGRNPRRQLEKVATPGQHTIDQIAAFFEVPAAQTLKTLIVVGTDGPVALVLRGDHELNEIKAQKLPGVASPLTFATEAMIRASVACGVGSFGPIGLALPTYVDRSARAAIDFICGANDDGYPLSRRELGRDVAVASDRVVDLRNVVDGDPSPDGKGHLTHHARHRSRTYLPTRPQVQRIAGRERARPGRLDEDADHGLLRNGRHAARRRDHRAMPRRRRHHLAATGRAVHGAHRRAQLRQVRRRAHNGGSAA